MRSSNSQWYHECSLALRKQTVHKSQSCFFIPENKIEEVNHPLSDVTGGQKETLQSICSHSRRDAPTGLSVALQPRWNRVYVTHNIWNTTAVFFSESLRPGGEGRRRGATHHLLLIHVSHTKPDIKHRSVMRLTKHSSAHWTDQGRAEAGARKQIDPSSYWHLEIRRNIHRALGFFSAITQILCPSASSFSCFRISHCGPQIPESLSELLATNSRFPSQLPRNSSLSLFIWRTENRTSVGLFVYFSSFVIPVLFDFPYRVDVMYLVPPLLWGRDLICLFSAAAGRSLNTCRWVFMWTLGKSLFASCQCVSVSEDICLLRPALSETSSQSQGVWMSNLIRDAFTVRPTKPPLF